MKLRHDRLCLRQHQQAGWRPRTPQGLCHRRLSRQNGLRKTTLKALPSNMRFWNERGRQLRGHYESHSEIALPTITTMTMAKPISSHGMSLRSRGVTRPSSLAAVQAVRQNGLSAPWKKYAETVSTGPVSARRSYNSRYCHSFPVFVLQQLPDGPAGVNRRAASFKGCPPAQHRFRKVLVSLYAGASSVKPSACRPASRSRRDFARAPRQAG